MDIRELETADYDVLENVKTAFYRLWKLKMVVVLVTLIGFLTAIVYIGFVGVHTNYYASASIYSAIYGSYEESEDGVTVMNTYSGLLGSSRVCERAVGNLQNANITATQLKNMVSAGRIYLSGASKDSKSYGYQLTLVVVSTSSENIVEIANAMAQAFADEINDLMGSSSLQLFEEATGYASAQSINITLYFLLFGALAFVGTAALIFVKEFFSVRVYSVAQCEPQKELILGLIPYNAE